MNTAVRRREFIRTTVVATCGAVAGAGSVRAGVAAAMAVSEPLFAVPPLGRVRVGILGAGRIGSSHAVSFLKLPRTEVAAVCDLVPERVGLLQHACVMAGASKPVGYSGGPRAWRRLIDADLDLVVVTAPPGSRASMCIAAMNAGKHVATAVPMATSVDDCWQMVEAAEATRRHCVSLDGCCCDRAAMTILNVVRQDVLGDLIHAECGDATHGIGPVSQWLDITRGNRYEHLVATGRSACGPNTILQTSRGQTVIVTHGTGPSRPYSRKILLQGTKGIVQDYRWKPSQNDGTSDVPRAVVHCLREGMPMDIDVYDGATWIAVCELSALAIARPGRSLDVPDFTRGAWRRRPPLGVVTG